jgi:hypothetical protein
MKTSTRKVGKFDRKNRKSKKKYIKKRRKYTQKGRGLGDVVKKGYSSAAKIASKFTRGPTDRKNMNESMQNLQEELKKRKKNSEKMMEDCPLCLDTSVGKLAPITGTPDEINRVASANDMCQPCSQCSHPFHKGCVSNLTNHSGLVKLSKCPICRSNNFKEGQLQVENERTKKLIVEIGERIKKSQLELTLINSEIKNSKDPDVLTELQNRLDSLEKKIDVDEMLLHIYISNDYDYDSDGSMSAED